MNIYIRATGNISPQKTFGHGPFLTEPMWYEGNRLTSVEPDYKSLIDPKMIRRMSRIIKMGVAAASDCLQESGLDMPGAIITGTAYGCLEDTGVFLAKMVEQREEMLTPTAFIQSTHNTVGAQIALTLHCHNYNNTFVHRGFSFESALLDAILLLRENGASSVLAGGVDEITDISHAILTRFNLYKKASASTSALFQPGSSGTIAGEGASFFLLDKNHSAGDYAQLAGMSTFYKPRDNAEIENRITSFLREHELQFDEIDLVINGKNGDCSGDAIYEQIERSLFRTTISLPYKHLCGEYPTATAFGLWLAANMLKKNVIPAAVGNIGSQKRTLKTILIYNHYLGVHHSLFLLRAC